MKPIGNQLERSVASRPPRRALSKAIASMRPNARHRGRALQAPSKIALILAVASLAVIGSASVAEAGQPDAAVLDAYRQFLGGLPKDQPNSVSKAIEYYEREIIDHGPSTRDHAFLIFLDFHREVCRGVEKRPSEDINRVIQAGGDPVEYWERLQRTKEFEQLQIEGLEMHGDSEGSGWIRGIPGHIPGIMKPYVSESLQRFLDLRGKELEEGYVYDASLRISFERLAERLGQWEEYLEIFPNSLVKADAAALRDEYLVRLLCGVSNTAPEVYDGGEDIKGIYRRFVECHPGTNSARIITAFAKKYQENGWRLSRDTYTYACELCSKKDHWESFPGWSIQLDYRVMDYDNVPAERD